MGKRKQYTVPGAVSAGDVDRILNEADAAQRTTQVRSSGTSGRPTSARERKARQAAAKKAAAGGKQQSQRPRDRRKKQP